MFLRWSYPTKVTRRHLSRSKFDVPMAEKEEYIIRKNRCDFISKQLALEAFFILCMNQCHLLIVSLM
jgi:hypothetical protein